jgi:hypothetical protein
MHLHKLSDYGLYSGYLNWLLRYLTKGQSLVRYSGILSSPCVVQSGVNSGVSFRAFAFSYFYK